MIQLNSTIVRILSFFYCQKFQRNCQHNLSAILLILQEISNFQQLFSPFDITGCCFYFAFNFCNIFVNIFVKPSTPNQNLLQLCIIDFMKWEFVFCAHPTVPNLSQFLIIFVLSQSSTFSVNTLFTIVTENPFLPIINMLITSKTCVVNFYIVVCLSMHILNGESKNILST